MKRPKIFKSSKLVKVTVKDAFTDKVKYEREVRANVVGIITAIFVIAIAIITYFTLSYTPLRYTINGYPTKESKQIAVENQLRLDSLENVIAMWAFHVSNIQRVVTGREVITLDSLNTITASDKTKYYDALYASQDSILRSEVESAESLQIGGNRVKIDEIDGLHMFHPAKSIIIEPFNNRLNHPYLTLKTDSDAPIYAILDGSVVSIHWSDDSGYTLWIQHDNNILTIYRNIAKSIVSMGDRIKSGSVIAVAGNTQDQESGMLLQFEMWHKGKAIDPTEYIKF
jgi:murein DD-endopeptidase MepM/ murein hydrolase activator NlpD